MFCFSYNSNIKAMVTDKIGKATRVASNIPRALKMDRNVSASFDMRIFNKKIASILFCVYPMWCLGHIISSLVVSIVKSNNFFHIEEQPEPVNTCNVVNQVFISTSFTN